MPRRIPGDLARLAAQIRRCTRCGLSKSRAHAVPGEGPARARLFLVGEAPGRTEDEHGRPFTGRAGKVLDDAMRRAGIHRQRTFITNTVKCRPPRNRKPRAREEEACRPYLVAQLLAVRPAAIVALGQTATTELLGTAPLSRARGQWREFRGIPVLPTYHPAAVLYNRRLARFLAADLRKAMRRAEDR